MTYKERLLGSLKLHEGVGIVRGEYVTYCRSLDSCNELGIIHALYDALDEESLRRFVDENPFMRQYAYTEFLFEFNGVDLFYNDVSLYGLHILTKQRKSFVDACIPGDLVSENRSFSGYTDKYGGIIIGSSTRRDLARFFSEVQGGRILSIERPDSVFEPPGRITNEWPSFESFLFEEIARLNRELDVEIDSESKP